MISKLLCKPLLIKNFLLIIVLILFISCQTNPPTTPFSLKTGEVQINISVTEDNSIGTERTVLLEDFANVSCNPCVASNKIIRSVLAQYGCDKIVSVKFPTNFPSAVDPFYLVGKQYCDFRMSYYNILFAPTIILDGICRPAHSDSNAMKDSLDVRINQPSNFLISVTKIVNNGGLLLNIDIKVKDKGSLNLSELFLRTALVESEIEFTTPPGSNGETKFYDVLRSLFPDNNGIPLTSLNNMNTFQYDNVIDNVWNLDKLEAVVFIQDETNKKIQQTGSTFN